MKNTLKTTISYVYVSHVVTQVPVSSIALWLVVLLRITIQTTTVVELLY